MATGEVHNRDGGTISSCEHLGEGDMDDICSLANSGPTPAVGEHRHLELLEVTGCGPGNLGESRCVRGDLVASDVVTRRTAKLGRYEGAGGCASVLGSTWPRRQRGCRTLGPGANIDRRDSVYGISLASNRGDMRCRATRCDKHQATDNETTQDLPSGIPHGQDDTPDVVVKTAPRSMLAAAANASGGQSRTFR